MSFRMACFNEAAALRRGKPAVVAGGKVHLGRASGFNEAAALRRGKRQLNCGTPMASTSFHKASMRPRHYAAENKAGQWFGQLQQGYLARFNEAAALRRGKRGPMPVYLLSGVEPRASMRPRHYAAENLLRAPGSHRAMAQLQ